MPAAADAAVLSPRIPLLEPVPPSSRWRDCGTRTAARGRAAGAAAAASSGSASGVSVSRSAGGVVSADRGRRRSGGVRAEAGLRVEIA